MPETPFTKKHRVEATIWIDPGEMSETGQRGRIHLEWFLVGEKWEAWTSAPGMNKFRRMPEYDATSLFVLMRLIVDRIDEVGQKDQGGQS